MPHCIVSLSFKFFLVNCPQKEQSMKSNKRNRQIYRPQIFIYYKYQNVKDVFTSPMINLTV